MTSALAHMNFRPLVKSSIRSPPRACKLPQLTSARVLVGRSSTHRLSILSTMTPRSSALFPDTPTMSPIAALNCTTSPVMTPSSLSPGVSGHVYRTRVSPLSVSRPSS
eukprot:CAMPEP_0177724210 /NCGR_PEP_ID=MMETSP0484_2-20121128/18610_1 /TAXON_ID=354590 /ORGANISM="Rhodomonas lens, Strain RHODO" /LENGTH=107 /DNA_ID=CAMNT_0019236669 /DNA_START=151 /DNA_END=470 /DNA_ORIENTATION=-